MHYDYTPRRITLTDQGKLIAKVMLHTEDGMTYIDHTFVDEAQRNKGIASDIVRETADYIRKSGNKIMPVCPYAVKWLELHKAEYSDLMAY